MSTFFRQFLFLSVMLGMVFNPVLAALNCMANCGKVEQSVLGNNSVDSSVALANSLSEHCQKMMQQKQSAELQDASYSAASDKTDTELVDAQDDFSACECVASCGASAAALISLSHSLDTMFNYQRTDSLAVQMLTVALVRNPYRPPIA